MACVKHRSAHSENVGGGDEGYACRRGAGEVRVHHLRDVTAVEPAERDWDAEL